MARYLKINWWNAYDLGDVIYQTGYKNIIYLDVEISKPEYNLIREVEQDGDANEKKVFEKWEKVYVLDIWGTEDLVDAFTYMQLHSNIEIILQSGKQINVKDMAVETAWEENGCLCKITCRFTEEYVISTNCDTNLDTSCLCESQSHFEDVISIGSAKFTDPTGNGVNVGDIYLVYSGILDGGLGYNAYVREYTALASDEDGWAYLAGEQDEDPETGTQVISCWIDDDTTEEWISYEAGIFRRFPGYIFELTNVGNTLTVKAYLPPYCYAKVLWSFPPGAYTEVGEYTRSELLAGVSFDVSAGAGLYYVKLNTLMHNECDYGDTEYESIVI